MSSVDEVKMDRPPYWGINHLKLAAADIIKTRDFYCNIMGTEYLPHYDHHNKNGELFAVKLHLSHKDDNIIVELRRNEEQAKAQEHWDPITLGVRTKDDLETWKQWFEQNGVECSKVFSGLKGWVLCALDPDRKIVRIYCDEEHEWNPKLMDTDEFWLR